MRAIRRSTMIVCALAAFCLGCFLGGAFSANATLLVYALCTTAVLVLFALKRSRVMLCLLVSLGACLIGALYASITKDSLQAYSGPTHNVRIRGTIRDSPTIQGNRQKIIITGTEYGTLIATIPLMPLVYQFDTIALEGSRSALENFSETFDYIRYLRGKGVTSQIEARRDGAITVTHTPLSTALHHVRQYLDLKLSRALPDPHASLAKGLLFGDDSGLPKDITDDFRTTGTGHITAISGANIAIFLGITATAIPLHSLRGKLLLTLGISCGLSFLTGGSASVIRGATMASIASLVRALGLPENSTATLFLAMSSMLVVAPLAISHDLGFQLSFAAFAGISYLQKPISQLTQFLFSRLPSWFSAPLLETTAATVGTYPISAAMGSTSVLGLLTNPLILPLIPIATALGLLIIIVPGSEVLLSIPLWVVLSTVLSIISRTADPLW